MDPTSAWFYTCRIFFYCLTQVLLWILLTMSSKKYFFFIPGTKTLVIGFKLIKNIFLSPQQYDEYTEKIHIWMTLTQIRFYDSILYPFHFFLFFLKFLFYFYRHKKNYYSLVPKFVLRIKWGSFPLSINHITECYAIIQSTEGRGNKNWNIYTIRCTWRQHLGDIYSLLHFPANWWACALTI